MTYESPRIPRSPNGWDVLILAGLMIACALAVAFTSGCGPITIPPIQDCRLAGQECKPGSTCTKPTDGSLYPYRCVTDPVATPTPPPSPTPSPSPTATPPPPPSTPTPTPQPLPTPSPTPSPCVPRQEKVCVGSEGGPILGLFNPNATSGPTACWTAATWLDYMIRHGYFTVGTETDGDLHGFPGYWLNYNASHVLVGQINKVTARNPAGRYVGDAPFMELREVPCPGPTPTPRPSATPPPPVPTPTPTPGGCPDLLKVGGMFLSAVDCGPQCRKQGYLGVRVNVTATELCREGDPGCVCDPTRNRCEMPRQCQNPAGATTYISLPGKFEDDLCDANSDNPFNCHHKPKADEAGVTEFNYCPHAAAPDDPRCTAKCIDVREFGTREVTCPRAPARLTAAAESAPDVTPMEWFGYGLLVLGSFLGVGAVLSRRSRRG